MEAAKRKGQGSGDAEFLLGAGLRGLLVSRTACCPVRVEAGKSLRRIAGARFILQVLRQRRHLLRPQSGLRHCTRRGAPTEMSEGVIWARPPVRLGWSLLFSGP